ncbi:SDR family NAD(P)-dependent oxidoreductase [Microvirga rosea]|uniref:SDR family NAD(P)-dependent oxidoreductase n=1 Tax=Microvirga rosea TaxID=2715425 RepID=UPI001D0B628B|nr:SDR family NAD(P)-dependent oxidoreductase [Microvirga rosea]MCB8823001.1 SDR family NAD(P)-dependent oxidoreductase [Microvirga rosea]
MTGKRVLVTGGAGFIGSHIVDQLVQAGCGEIIVIDNMVRGRPENLSDAMGSGRVRLIEGDIRDKDLLSDAVKGSDTVFHQAALRITHCAAEPKAAMEVMVDATFNLLDLCVSHSIRKIVMASSASVYGMADEFPTTERQNPYNNRTLYGAAKAFGEGLLRSYNDMYGLSYVALRYFNVFGPRMDIHGRYTEVMIRWMERIAAGLPPVIFGDGQQTMDLIHVKDVARANILAAISPANDVALNIGSGTETSLLDLAYCLARTMGRPGLVPVHEAERAVNPVPRRLSDPSAAQRLIGFRTTLDTEAGVAELVRWWQDQQTEPEIRGVA